MGQGLTLDQSFESVYGKSFYELCDDYLVRIIQPVGEVRGHIFNPPADLTANRIEVCSKNEGKCEVYEISNDNNFSFLLKQGYYYMSLKYFDDYVGWYSEFGLVSSIECADSIWVPQAGIESLSFYAGNYQLCE